MLLLILALFYTSSLTHSGEPELQPYVSQALSLWGQSSSIQDAGPGPDIYITYGQIPGSSSAYPELVSGVIRSCRIEVNPEYKSGLDPEGLLNVLTHELGHCLGLVHPGFHPSIMESTADGFSPYDSLTIGLLYPPQTKSWFVPGLSMN